MYTTFKALSIRQPWAWLIVYGCKDIENRDWPTRYRGPLLIHAAKTMTRTDYEAARLFVDSFDPALAILIPDPDELHRGAIVGVATLTGCVEDHDSDWFCGDYGFVLERPEAFLPPAPFSGALGLFDVPTASLPSPIADRLRAYVQLLKP